MEVVQKCIVFTIQLITSNNRNIIIQVVNTRACSVW